MSEPHPLPVRDTPFVNEVRLNGRQWLWVAAIVLLVVCLTPVVWPRLERLDTSPDSRLPYALSKDYWLYSQRLKLASDPARVIVLGDSVVWGEYVRPDGTLSHFLNREAEQAGRYVNAGLNGLFPLAMEGLVRDYAPSLHHRKVLLHANVLWMSSPKADLRTTKEERFNHARLAPQFFPRIPCYRADANERLSALIERNVGFIAWIGHLQNAYFGQKSVLQWSLEDDGSDPPRYPNCYRNPLGQITLAVPAEPPDDPQRGPASARHRPWSAAGNGPTRFEWVPLESSLQWAAFCRVVRRLQARGNSVFVLLGPFNEHLIAPEAQSAYRTLHEGISAWLAGNRVPHLAPAPLPSELYADASHPLTEGYARLAKQLHADGGFQTWAAGGTQGARR